MFQLLKARFDQWRAFRELGLVNRNEGRAFSRYFVEQIDLARQAFAAGNREQALRIWTGMHLEFPDLALFSERGLALMLDLGCFDEADAMMQSGLKRYPHHAHFARGHAQSAQRRRNSQEALRRCEFLRAKFPRIPEGYTIAAACLTDLGCHDDAEAMIGRGVAKLPDNFEMHVQHARNAAHRHDWPEALRRWEMVRSGFGEQFLGPLGLAQSLRELGRYAEAEEIILEACERFHNVDWVLAEAADLATAQGNFDEAVQRWKALLRKSPGFALGYPKGAEAMRKIGQESEADELLATGVERVKADLPVHLEYARSADRRGDLAGAAKRWALVRERFPECAEARHQEVAARVPGERQGLP